MSEKSILCYSDSNAWGWNPATQTRYARLERWPGVLPRELEKEYQVIELPGCALLNATELLGSSDKDLIQLELRENMKLGRESAARVRQILEG
jgi:lysophospholipase L1-like esterase